MNREFYDYSFVRENTDITVYIFQLIVCIYLNTYI